MLILDIVNPVMLIFLPKTSIEKIHVRVFLDAA